MRNLLTLGALILSTVASAKVVWRGDFETGDLSQWSEIQEVSPDRLALVPDAREGKYALKATVVLGDDPINASGNRNELAVNTNEPTGSEFFYKWSTKFDESYPSNAAWQLFAQWHHTGLTGSPPVQFVVKGEQMRLEVGPNGNAVWTAPLERGKWRDFVFHVKWSPDASVGFVELYLDGALVLPKTMAQTQFSGQLNYLKVGLYRSEAIGPTGIVYHDGWMQATTLEDVLPPVAAVIPAAEPTPATRAVDHARLRARAAPPGSSAASSRRRTRRRPADGLRELGRRRERAVAARGAVRPHALPPPAREVAVSSPRPRAHSGARRSGRRARSGSPGAAPGARSGSRSGPRARRRGAAAPRPRAGPAAAAASSR